MKTNIELSQWRIMIALPTLSEQTILPTCLYVAYPGLIYFLMELLQRCIQSLVHACQCKDANCRRLSCHKMKRVVQHTRACKKRQTTNCPVCKQLIALCCYHAKHCNGAQCQVNSDPVTFINPLNEKQIRLCFNESVLNWYHWCRFNCCMLKV